MVRPATEEELRNLETQESVGSQPTVRKATPEEIQLLEDTKKGPSDLREKTIDTSIKIAETGTDVSLALATGAFQHIASGSISALQGITSYIRGDEDPMADAEEMFAFSVQEPLYQPRTKEGREFLRAVGIGFQIWDDFAAELGNRAVKDTGSPAIGTALKTALVAGPDLIGLKGFNTRAGRIEGVGDRLGRRRQQLQAEQEAQDINLNLRESPDVQKGQIIEQARTETGKRIARGQNLEEIQNSVIEAKAIAKQNVDDLYTQARAGGASIPISEVKNFRAIAEESLRDFDVETMPVIQRRLTELKELDNLPEGSRIKLNELAKFRQRLNRNRPPTNDPAANAANAILKGQLDTFLDAQFNSDMISGDPAALAKWKKATEASRQYKEQFKDSKVVRQLAEQEADPEVVRSWIFGSSKLGFKRESADVIRRIKGIVGEDSPQFTALRQDALLNVMDPLLKENPSFTQFARVYDDLIKNNPSLVKELFPDSATHLRQLREFATAIEKNKTPPLGIKVEETISRALFGHQIAQAAVRVSFGGLLLKQIRRMGEKTQRARILGDVLGFEPDAPVIPLRPALIGGAQETVKQESVVEESP